jgi:DNA-binding transcriptional LysR family regulator
MTATDPLARRERLRIADLVGMRMIARCACERPHILPRDVIKPIIVAQAHDEESVLALVSAGIGLAVVPGYDSDTPEVVARQVEEFTVERWVVAIGNPALVERARKAVRDARRPLSL